jgi:hypothetical protein
MGPEIERPWVGMLEARIDVTDNQPVIIAEIEDGNRVLSSCAPASGSKQEPWREPPPERDPTPAGPAIEPAVQRRDEMLDYPDAQEGPTETRRNLGRGTAI